MKPSGSLLKFFLLFIIFGLVKIPLTAQNSNLYTQTERLSEQIEKKVIKWRRDLHQHPELSNREFRTAEKVASHLKALGLEVQSGVAHTGVVGILKGGLDGPVVALRADMDALPVTERVDLPFASKVMSDYNGQKVGVMHACGHDTHVAILMGVAEVLSKVKDDLKGTVKFIFQPAEEGAPEGEEGGAKMMVREGVLDNPKVEAIFGLHINSRTPVGEIRYRAGGTMASVNSFKIIVKGQQTHGSTPWTGIDPIVTSAQIINSLQTVVSRHSELTKEAAVVSIGSIHGGVRSNIIPEEVEMLGTIRALNEGMRLKIIDKIKRISTKVAESQGATAEVIINEGYPITYNDPALTAMMLPSLQNVGGQSKVKEMNAITGAEDFSFFQKKVPGLYFFLGGMSADGTIEEAAPHHTPDFFIDESGMLLGVKAFCRLVIDYADKKEGNL
ncbi:amidohydrolase [Xanthovirga aplysinae]|uniref:amidohydrolase n=1 Tax=Xanthovirga aplysinae TaxID=2529853 RepID=UPI0012BCAD5D|nr:amidohydrolase [Xanthovirga aplysinae]MTI32728.1 amidohydrolase [Xanthovirga aplysinae]